MAVARLLFFGLILVGISLPGHPLAPLGGLPLDLPSLAIAGLVVAWWIGVPGLPPRPRLIAAVLAAFMVAKVAVGLLAPAYGIVGTYRAAETPAALAADAGAPATVRIDRALDFRGDTFPVHFFNDVQRFNYFTPSEPKRDLLPFAARWSGQLVVPAAGPRTLTLEANGPATLVIGGIAGPVRSVATEVAGRLTDVSLTAELPAGLVPIVVTYQRPPEAMPWLVLRSGPSGADAPALGPPSLVADAAQAAALDREIWLRPLAWAASVGFLATLVLSLGAHVRVTRPAPLARSVLALYWLLSFGRELVAHAHLHGRAVILSGGNDWLAYESFARDLLINGPLLTEGRPLGQGVPFYYQPLYIYAVAASHLVLGEGLFAPLLLNVVLGIAAGLLLFVLTRELFGTAAGLVAVVLFEAYRLTVFAPTAGLLLSENLVFPLVATTLWLFARAAKTGAPATIAGAGVVLGLAGLARTTPLALLPPALLILLIGWRKLGLGWAGIGGRLGLVILACTLTVGVATTRNYVVSGRPVPITSSAGANLWETHRPSDRVDLSRIDRDPLYERLGLDRQTREVAEFVRQDPGGYAATLAPMFLYAIGVVGAVGGSTGVHAGLLGMCLAYLAVALLAGRARSVPVWFVHAFVWSHLAQMTVFFSHQYGFRLILPMYVAMVPVVALGVVAVGRQIRRAMAPLVPRATASRVTLPPVARGLLVVVALGGAVTGMGAVGLQSDQSRREALYGLNGDAALAVRQAGRPDLMRRVDSAYFVGDDSRSTDVAYLRGLAYPTPRWFDGARGLVLPPPGEYALYVLPEKAAADLARRCLGDAALLGRERDGSAQATLDLFIADAGTGTCASPRERIGAPFADAGRLVGLDGPASIEPGQPLDVMISWEVSERPANRTRPFVRLVDSQGRRWGQAETAVYPSATWRPGERAVGLARIETDPSLPPGQYRLDGGFAAGTTPARLAEDGPWGVLGLPIARGSGVRLVSRSSPPPVDSLPLDRRIMAELDGVRLLGADLERASARAGERVRLGLFWQNAGGRLADRAVSLVLRGPDGWVVHERRGVPVDGTYPFSAWKPGEIVRDTWDLVLPTSLAAGSYELAAGLAAPDGSAPASYVSLGTVAVQAASRPPDEPTARQRIGERFANGVELAGLDAGSRRPRPGEPLDLTLLWRADRPVAGDLVVVLAVIDARGRVLVTLDGEPAGGKRPTSGWAVGELIDDGWKPRLPRDAARSGLRLTISLADGSTGQRVQTEAGRPWIEVPLDGPGD